MDDQRIPRHLAPPDSVASDPKAFELLAAWAAAGKVTAMSARRTELKPEMWGEILASIADNIALAAQSTTNTDPQTVLAAIKEGMDREWGKRSLDRAKLYQSFTDRARKVMQLANQEAQRFNHEYIGTEHILLGLIEEGSGAAANVLKNLDVDPRKIRLEVEKFLQSGPDMLTMGKLPQTPRAKWVIQYSMEEALNLNHNYVGTEHLLLGLLREMEGVAAQVLMNLGLTLGKVRDEILQILGPGSPPDRDHFGFG